MKYNVSATAFFEKKLKKLSRKYPGIRHDFEDLLDELETGPYQADRLRGVKGPVFKIRMASRDMQKGKSGGFRVIYLVQEKEKSVFLLTLYPKGERENIDAGEVNAILKSMGITP